MKIIDIIILLAALSIVTFTVGRHFFMAKKSKGCGNCEGCGGACRHSSIFKHLPDNIKYDRVGNKN